MKKFIEARPLLVSALAAIGSFFDSLSAPLRRAALRILDALPRVGGARAIKERQPLCGAALVGREEARVRVIGQVKPGARKRTRAQLPLLSVGWASGAIV